MKVRSKGILLAGGVFCGCLLFAQTTNTPAVKTQVAVGSFMVELSADIQAKHMKPGGTVSTKVLFDWKGLNCTLLHGTVLQAHVMSVVPHSKESKDSQLALAFDKAPCGNPGLASYTPTLAALSAPPEYRPDPTLDMPNPIGTLRSPTSTLAEDAYRMQYWITHTLTIGEVYEIRGMSLSVGTGPQHSSVLTMKNRDLALDKHTPMLLVLTPDATLVPTSTNQADGAEKAPGATVPPVPHP
jgi:hypothetical protein